MNDTYHISYDKLWKLLINKHMMKKDGTLLDEPEPTAYRSRKTRPASGIFILI